MMRSILITILIACMIPAAVWGWGVVLSGGSSIGKTTFTFVDDTEYDSSSSSSAECTKPTGTAENDIMFALVLRHGSETDPNSTPSGWTVLATMSNYGNYMRKLYYKVAGASEPATYTWGWAVAEKTVIVLSTYRGGFDTADPIDVVSNTEYSNTNTTCRAAGMTVSAVNSPLVVFLTNYRVEATTFTTPANPSGWASDADDKWAWQGDYNYETCSLTWASSGATGNIDSTLSISSDEQKHAFAVALNPE
jgi:hypothetical protein